MRPDKERLIRRLAYKARDAVECIINYEYDNNNGYHNCVGTLAGMCARASAILSYLFDQHDIEHQIAYGYGHVYIECDDKIIDVTATQFSLPGRTLIRPIKKMCKNYRWRTSILFSSVDHLIRWQSTERWPWEQSVTERDLEFL